MLQSNFYLEKSKQLPESQLKTITNRTLIPEQDRMTLVIRSAQDFKISQLLQKASRNLFIKELARLVIYTFLLMFIVSSITTDSSSSMYSFTANLKNDQRLNLRKQIKGLFPSLTNDWKLLLNTWNLTVLERQQGNLDLQQLSYQIQFKYGGSRQNVLYITKENCNGHLIMNWQLYGHNIYLTEFVPPKDSMIIPNFPEDERCINGNSEILNLLKFSTIWTVKKQYEKTSLFLLIEKYSSGNKDQFNSVLIGQRFQKS